MEEEGKIDGSIEPITIKETKIILSQMKNCICKLKINNKIGTGFFCKIPFKNNKMMKVLMTNYHILNEIYYTQNKALYLNLNDEKELKVIDLTLERKRYFSKEYDLTLIELKDIDIDENNCLDLDDNLFRDKINSYFKKKSVYILHYPFGKKAAVSYGFSIEIENSDIKHSCNTEHGSSGSPILNLSNNKVIGIHKYGYSNKNNF